ncbi:hypothetical protein BSKO_10956 [Bryopsis sp. KO-2023]|nr:hypothetical protein BSKO_10956 [Bryopsis sp. KO-2023]
MGIAIFMVLVLAEVAELADVLSAMNKGNEGNAVEILEEHGTLKPMTLGAIISEYLNRKLHIWAVDPILKPLECLVEPNLESLVAQIEGNLLTVGTIGYAVLEPLTKEFVQASMDLLEESMTPMRTGGLGTKTTADKIIGFDDANFVEVEKKGKQLRRSYPREKAFSWMNKVIAQFWPQEILPTSGQPLRMLAARRHLEDGKTVGGLVMNQETRARMLETMATSIFRILFSRENQRGVQGGQMEFFLGYSVVKNRITDRIQDNRRTMKDHKKRIDKQEGEARPVHIRSALTPNDHWFLTETGWESEVNQMVSWFNQFGTLHMDTRVLLCGVVYLLCGTKPRLCVQVHPPQKQVEQSSEEVYRGKQPVARVPRVIQPPASGGSLAIMGDDDQGTSAVADAFMASATAALEGQPDPAQGSHDTAPPPTDAAQPDYDPNLTETVDEDTTKTKRGRW